MKKHIAFAVALTLVFAMCTMAVSAAPGHQRGPPAHADTETVFHVTEGESIQAAIDAAPDGAVIFVHEGTYVERLLIDGKDLKLKAVGEVVVREPNPAESSSKRLDTIGIYASTCVIDGFIVDVNSGHSGITARGTDVEVNVTIKNNEVKSYDRNGITVNGKMAFGNVSNNLVYSTPDSGWANNGIQFGYGSTGIIRENTVKGNYWLGEGWTACGILLFDVSDVKVVKNDILEGNQCAIAVLGSNNKIINNYLDTGDYGILTYDSDWYLAYDWYDNLSGDENNKIINNTIIDFSYAVYDAGAESKNHANK